MWAESSVNCRAFDFPNIHFLPHRSGNRGFPSQDLCRQTWRTCFMPNNNIDSISFRLASTISSASKRYSTKGVYVTALHFRHGPLCTGHKRKQSPETISPSASVGSRSYPRQLKTQESRRHRNRRESACGLSAVQIERSCGSQNQRQSRMPRS